MRSGGGKVVSAPFAWQGSSSTDAKSRPYEKSSGDHISAGTGLRDDVGFARSGPVPSIVGSHGCRQGYFQACQLLWMSQMARQWRGWIWRRRSVLAKD